MSSTHTLQLQQNNHIIMSAREEKHDDIIMEDTESAAGGKTVCDTNHKDNDMDIETSNSTKQVLSMAELEKDFFHLMNKSIQINDEWNKKKEEKGLSFDLEGLSSGVQVEDVPVFLTCDKCSLVFGDKQEAWTHEQRCTRDSIDIQEGKVFDDKNLLIQFIIDYQTSNKKVLNEDDKVYFVSSEEYINYQDHNQQEDRGTESSSKDIQVEDEKNGTDKQNTHEEDDKDYDTADMNLIQHLCSTTIDPKTGLPTQKLTVMCGESGKINLRICHDRIYVLNIFVAKRLTRHLPYSSCVKYRNTL